MGKSKIISALMDLEIDTGGLSLRRGVIQPNHLYKIGGRLPADTPGFRGWTSLTANPRSGLLLQGDDRTRSLLPLSGVFTRQEERGEVRPGRRKIAPERYELTWPS